MKSSTTGRAKSRETRKRKKRMTPNTRSNVQTRKRLLFSFHSPRRRFRLLRNPLRRQRRLAPSTVKITSVEKEDIKSMFIAPAAVRTCLSLQDILKHRISKEEMTQQKAFANYSYGEPSTKLYLRNMVKDVTADDILKLFGCFFDNDDQAKEQVHFIPVMRRSLEIRVMEGRMKGQAFVTFPSVELAREALTTVNGYLLRDKPVVVVGGIPIR